MKHRYRIDPDYFLRMAMARKWQVVPIHGVLFVCELPERELGAKIFSSKRAQFRVADVHIGTYGPISQCFHTDRVPAKPDRRVIPWCDCCWQRAAGSV